MKDTTMSKRQTEEFCFSLVESTSDSMYLVDENCRYLFVNSQHSSRMGMILADIIGRPYEEFHSPDQTEIFVEKVKQVFKTGKSVQQEHHSRRDGRYFLRTFSPIKEAGLNGQIISVAVVSKDITGHKIVEENLRRERGFVSDLIQASPAFFVAIGADGKIIMMNDAFLNALGYSHEQVVGKDYLYTIVPERDRDLLSTVFEKLVISHEPSLNENYVLTGDNQELLVEWHGRPVFDGEGNFLYFFGVGIDITERKQAEKALRESEEKYRTMLNNIEDGYYEADLPGNLTFVNPSMSRILGYSREEMIGMNNRQYMEKATARRIFHVFNKVYKTGVPTRYVDWEVIRKDGTKAVVECSVSLKRDALENPIGFRGILHDITERRRAEDALRESEEKYRLVVENASDAILVAQDGIMKFVNRRTVDLFGYPEEILTAKPFIKFIHPEDRSMVLDRHERRVRGEDLPPVYPFRVLAEDGTLKWVEIHAIIIMWEGKPATLNFIRDVTERRRADEERKTLGERLRRGEKMEALGTLAGGVAHDLNNALAVLVGYSELLLMEIPEDNPWREKISKIEHSSHRAAAIISDLLTLARRGVAASQVVNFNKVISDYFNTPQFEKLKIYHPHVIFKADLEQDLLNIKGSPVHLEKTIMNLISNASEAISDRGEVKIQTKNLYIDTPIMGYDEVQQGDYVVLTVSDNGMGISSKDIEKIFEPFYTKKVMGRSGTGLGLAVVWGTVKDHKGYIDVQSEEGKGTTFSLYFPVTREALFEDQISISVSEYIGNSESILVVDDIEVQRELAVQMLKKLNYAVATVSSGEEAAEYLKKNKVDLIVLDMIMDPGIDGLETYERILEINPRQRAIIVSGFAETERVKKAQELGVGAYVRKPYILEKIGLAIREELDKK